MSFLLQKRGRGHTKKLFCPPIINQLLNKSQQSALISEHMHLGWRTGQLQKKDKTERATGLGTIRRNMRKQQSNDNYSTQGVKWHQTSLASLFHQALSFTFILLLIIYIMQVFSRFQQRPSHLLMKYPFCNSSFFLSLKPFPPFWAHAEQSGSNSICCRHQTLMSAGQHLYPTHQCWCSLLCLQLECCPHLVLTIQILYGNQVSFLTSCSTRPSLV